MMHYLSGPNFCEEYLSQCVLNISCQKKNTSSLSLLHTGMIWQFLLMNMQIIVKPLVFFMVALSHCALSWVSTQMGDHLHVYHLGI